MTVVPRGKKSTKLEPTFNGLSLSVHCPLSRDVETEVASYLKSACKFDADIAELHDRCRAM